MIPVEILGLHIEASSGTPLVILRESGDPHRVLPIFIGPLEAASIVTALEGIESPRPQTHDLFAAMLDRLHAHVIRAEVTALREGAFIAELEVDGPEGRMRLDARPSDAIALALRHDAEVFASEEVLAEAGTMLTEDDSDALTEAAIDDEVDEFRAFLEAISPEEFAELPSPEAPLAADAPLHADAEAAHTDESTGTDEPTDTADE